jgi:hypothetical protein
MAASDFTTWQRATLSQKKWLFLVVKKSPFWGGSQKNILDKKAPGALFGQCLQGFCVIKKPPTMGCTISALCAIMRKQSWNYDGRMQK